jgi:2-hydroxychromene-2-carboxylate isomerase
MDKVVDYYFAAVSPFTYLGHERFVAIAREHGAAIAVKPVDLGRIFPVSGGLPVAKRAPQRQAYRLVELKRWSEFLGVPLNVQPKYFPCSGDLASRWILAALGSGVDAALALYGAIGRALWAEERDVADEATLAAIAGARGLDAAGLAARAGTSDISERYDALTQEAIERGVFGAPFYIYRGIPFWGQDRLDFLARELAK